MPHNPKQDHRLDQTLERLWKAVYTPVGDLKATAWVTREPVPFAQRTTGKRLDCAPGTKWGEVFDCAWFRFTGAVPAAARGKPVALLIHLAGEALVVDARGNPVRGLTAMEWGHGHGLGRWDKFELPFLDRARGGERVDVWADAGCNNLFGGLVRGGQFQYARVAVYDPLVQALYFDFLVLRDLLGRLPETHARRHAVRAALHAAVDALAVLSPEGVRRARALLRPELQKRNGDPSFGVSAVGHAHIDLMWLWPERETWRKGARTFATALANMDDYPDYVFGASQPQLYQWMKEQYPQLYRRIRQRVREGRWECQGCMWVEADANVSGGEALVRQVLYGKRFYREEFGREINHLWLPDVFGYTAALPQILRKSGCPYFLTQKLSWSKVNIYPHHTFWWEGLDGSRVLTHFPPEDTYNSAASPGAADQTERNFKDKGVSDRAMMLFGCGDGGGGPGVEHLESLTRVRDLGGVPPVKQEPAARFFEHIAKDADRYATWAGELYLEFHQGTYTTQARNKRFNRKAELALRDCELWQAAAGQWLGRRGVAKRDLDRVWQRMLLFQFHDILPGSSITRVYDETRADYARLLGEVEGWSGAATEALAARIACGDRRAPVAVFNSLSWDRTEWVKAGNRWVRVTVPALGYAVADAAAPAARPAELAASATAIENALLRVEFDRDGAMRALVDKEHKRRVLAPGQKANVLRVYHDDGDAWDFSMDYASRPAGRFELAGSRAWVEGPRAICEQRYTYGQSSLVQRIVLTAGSRRLDFVTDVDWKENARMLRVDFPVHVLAREAVCDIQFGHVRRPTHRNTTWDMAKQEVCAHKWVDLSEPAYGVALLNDCKYGHQVKGNVINLNLLRSPGHPDPVADRAQHAFTYALYPHAGDHNAGAVNRAGYELNVPLRVCAAGGGRPSLPERLSLASVDASGVVVEAVKPAEDGRGVVVRLYEATGSATSVVLKTGWDWSRAELTDLLENPIQPLKGARGTVRIEFGPFEIQTVKLT